jgi:hypothetical protein
MQIGAAGREALLQWLRERGRGACLDQLMPEYKWSHVADFVHEALQHGALPSLRCIDMYMKSDTQQVSLTSGLLAGMDELRLTIACKHHGAEVEPQVAVLGLVRHLPALTKLEIVLDVWSHRESVQWPPFIPPSLKALHIDSDIHCSTSKEFLLPALPGMLAASGARLDRLEVRIPCDFKVLGDGLVHLAQALRYCSPTLNGLLLSTGAHGALFVPGRRNDKYGTEVGRLRVQWAELLAGVSVCRELQVLVLPGIQLEPLFPPGTAFSRLTHLEICDHEREYPAGKCDGAVGADGVGGAARPAKLSVRIQDRWLGMVEMRTRVAPALEAVAGTLTHLLLEKVEYGGSVNDKVEMAYELGVAVGKLQRLKDLALDLSGDGRVYHAFAQGLAASKGDRPLPLLWRVGVVSRIIANADLVASLLLPSVRVFIPREANRRALILIACALRQTGYKHAWFVCFDPYPPYDDLEGDVSEALGLLAPDCSCVVDSSSEIKFFPWIALPKGRLP